MIFTLRQWLTRANAWSHYFIALGGRPVITGAATYGALEGVNTLVPLPGGRVSRVAVSALAAGTAEGVLYAFGNEPSIKATYLSDQMKAFGDAYIKAEDQEVKDIHEKTPEVRCAVYLGNSEEDRALYERVCRTGSLVDVVGFSFYAIYQTREEMEGVLSKVERSRR